ncbi:hypothetical protein K438DRAFT_347617 [Mycena galopus ATCC 62051]|nr:hypothetical protein K438DRAFT_347617 [Mycena galopus ATCC 62051]
MTGWGNGDSVENHRVPLLICVKGWANISFWKLEDRAESRPYEVFLRCQKLCCAGFPGREENQVAFPAPFDARDHLRVLRVVDLGKQLCNRLVNQPLSGSVRLGAAGDTGCSSKRITTRAAGAGAAALLLPRSSLACGKTDRRAASGITVRCKAAVAYVALAGVGCGLDVGALVSAVVTVRGGGVIGLVVGLVVAVGLGVVVAEYETKWVRARVSCTVREANNGGVAQDVVCINVRVASAESRSDSRCL